MNDKIRIKQYIVIRETLLKSIVSDVFTFTSIGLLFYFNYKFMGNSWIVDLFIIFAYFILVSSVTKMNHQYFFTDRKKAAEYILNMKWKDDEPES